MHTRERVGLGRQFIADAQAERKMYGPPCITCKWVREAGKPEQAICHSPIARLAAMRFDPDRVTGGKMEAVRLRSDDGFCGPEAIYHENRGWRKILPSWQPTYGRQVNVRETWVAILWLVVIGGIVLWIAH